MRNTAVFAIMTLTLVFSTGCGDLNNPTTPEPAPTRAASRVSLSGAGGTAASSEGQASTIIFDDGPKGTSPQFGLENPLDKLAADLGGEGTTTETDETKEVVPQAILDPLGGENADDPPVDSIADEVGNTVPDGDAVANTNNGVGGGVDPAGDANNDGGDTGLDPIVTNDDGDSPESPPADGDSGGDSGNSGDSGGGDDTFFADEEVE